MPEYEYLIIGGGMAAGAAIRGIREVDRTGSICVLGADQNNPYARPPLSKGLWKDAPVSSVWIDIQDLGADLRLGKTARDLNLSNHRVSDDSGATYSYRKLLLATGGTPRRLSFGGESVIYYRTLDDYHRLRGLTEQRQRFAVIGGGFIGSEIAAALAMNQKTVSLIFPESAIGSRMFPGDLAQFLNRYYTEKGVEVLSGEQVIGMEERDGAMRIVTANRELLVDGVVAGIGIQPNIELAKAAGLETANGIIVDETLHTSDPDVLAAGDVAEFFNPALRKRLRVEHEDNANTMGGMAGRSMAGESVHYDHLPFFYSDLFDLGYEAVGDLDSRLETHAQWKEQYREGVVYYLENGRVRGVLLWNVWGKVDAARELIAQTGPFRPQDLSDRL